MIANVIEGQHPEHGRLFAAFDPAARFVQPAVAHSRFGALLSPFQTEAAAREALAAAGAAPDPSTVTRASRDGRDSRGTRHATKRRARTA